jgi:hypothetical protein
MQMLFLLGMYALLYQQCRSWSVACYTAVLSTAVIFVLGRGYWGLGTLSTMTPETVYLAFVPLLVWGFLRWIDSPRVLWIFLAAGLLANVHAVTGMNVTLVLAIAYLGHRRFDPWAWPTAILGGLCAAGAASPFLWHYFEARAAVGGGGSGLQDWSAVAQAFDRGELTLLYPAMLADALEFLGYTLVLWLPAVVVLLRAERFRARNLRVWVWMLIGSMAVGLLLHGVSQLAGVLRNSPPPVIDFVYALQNLTEAEGQRQQIAAMQGAISRSRTGEMGKTGEKRPPHPSSVGRAAD